MPKAAAHMQRVHAPSRQHETPPASRSPRGGRPIRSCLRYIRRLTAHEVGYRAAIIAFNAVYVVFPLVLFLIAIGGFIFRGPSERALILGEVRAAFPGPIGADVTGVINAARTYAGLFGVIGFLVLLWTGSNLFAATEWSLSRIFDVPPRRFVPQRIIAVLTILVFTAVLIVSIAVLTVALLLVRLPGALHDVHPGWVGRGAAGFVGGWIVSTALLAVIYWMIPSTRLPFSTIWPGALAAGIAIQITTLIFPFYAYMRDVAGLNRLGAAFSLVFLILTWFYVLSYILLLGAELNAFLYASRRARGAGPSS
jgi:membrane protein